MQGKALVISSYVPWNLREYAWKNTTLVGKNDWSVHRACLFAEMFNSFKPASSDRSNDLDNW
jgi:hypothetical protein